MFAGQAEEALRCYVNLLPNSSIESLEKYDANGGGWALPDGPGKLWLQPVVLLAAGQVGRLLAAQSALATTDNKTPFTFPGSLILQNSGR